MSNATKLVARVGRDRDQPIDVVRVLESTMKSRRKLLPIELMLVKADDRNLGVVRIVFVTSCSAP